MYAPVRTVHHERVSACAFGEAIEAVFTGGQGGTIRVWSVANDEPIAEWVAHDGRVEDLAALGGGALLSAGSDGAVKHWNTTTGDCLTTIRAHDEPATAVAATSDGETVVSGSYDATVRQWDLSAPSTPVAEVESSGKVVTVAMTTDVPLVAYGGVGSSVQLWNLDSEGAYPELQAHENAVMAVDFLDDGNTLVSTDHTGTVRWWDTETWTVSTTYSIDSPGEYPVYTTDSAVGVGMDHGVSIFTADGQVRSELDLAVGVLDLATSTDGSYLAVATYDGSIALYRAADQMAHS